MKTIIAYKRKGNNYFIPTRNMFFKTYKNMVQSFNQNTVFVFAE